MTSARCPRPGPGDEQEQRREEECGLQREGSGEAVAVGQGAEQEGRCGGDQAGRVAFTGARRPVVLGFPLDRARERLLLPGPSVGTVRFPVTRHRWEGFLDAWAGGGRPAAELRLAVCPVNDAEQGETLAAELLDGPDRPDAVAAMSDELALGALRAAARAGRRVPEDLAVTGWDDSDAAAPAGR